jgi:hypothetical protein
MGSAPISAPSGNPGQVASGLAQLREAIKIMEKALPALQPGSEPYKAVLNSMNSLTKYIPPTAEVAGMAKNVASGLLNDAQKGGAMSMVQGALAPAGASAGGGGGGAPPMPPTPAMPPSMGAGP